MRTRLTLRPGQNGTKRLCQEYGERLVCVRYRYDATRAVRLKTVELIVEEYPWLSRPRRALPPGRKVLLAVRVEERELRREVKAAGGTWRPELGAWELSHAAAERLGIEGLVIQERTPGRKGGGRWREKRPTPKHLPADAP